MVTGHCGFQATAEGRAMDGRDDGLLTILECGQHAPDCAHVALLPRSDLAELLDVGTCDKILAAADEHDGASSAVRSQRFDTSLNSFGDARAESVDGRIVDRDHAHAITYRHGREFGGRLHGCVFRLFQGEETWTICLPMFWPRSMPRKACGAFSRPAVKVSR